MTEEQKTGTVTIGGREYKTIRIGNLEIMAENLSFAKHLGESCDYGDFGWLFDYNSATTLELPDGWHLPSDDEWKTLEMALGMSSSDANNTGWRGTDQGTKLMQIGSSKINLQLGGHGYGPNPRTLGSRGYYWSSTELSSSSAWVRAVHSGEARVYRSGSCKAYRFSVRCVRNLMLE